MKRKLPDDGTADVPVEKKAKVAGKTFQKQAITRVSPLRDLIPGASSTVAPVTGGGAVITGAPKATAAGAAIGAAGATAPKPSAAAGAPKPASGASTAPKTGAAAAGAPKPAAATAPKAASVAGAAAAAAAAPKPAGAAAAAAAATALKPTTVVAPKTGAATTVTAPKPAAAGAPKAGTVIAPKPAAAAAPKSTAASNPTTAPKAGAAAATAPKAASATAAAHKPTAATNPTTASKVAAVAALKPTSVAIAAAPKPAAAAAAAAAPKPAAAAPKAGAAAAPKSAAAAAAPKSAASAAPKPAAAAAPKAASAPKAAGAAIVAPKPVAAAAPKAAPKLVAAAAPKAAPKPVAAAAPKPATAPKTTAAVAAPKAAAAATAPKPAAAAASKSTTASAPTTVTADAQQHIMDASLPQLSPQLDISAFGSQIPAEFVDIVMQHAESSLPPASMPPLEYATQDPRREVDNMTDDGIMRADALAAVAAAEAAAADVAVTAAQPAAIAHTGQHADESRRDAAASFKQILTTCDRRIDNLVTSDGDNDAGAAEITTGTIASVDSMAAYAPSQCQSGADDGPVVVLAGDADEQPHVADEEEFGAAQRPCDSMDDVPDFGLVASSVGAAAAAAVEPRARVSLRELLATNFQTGTNMAVDADMRASIDRLEVRNDLLLPYDTHMVAFSDALCYDERKEEQPAAAAAAVAPAPAAAGASSTAVVSDGFYRLGFADARSLVDLIDTNSESFWVQDVRVRDFSAYLELILIFSGYNRNALHRNGHFKSLQRTLDSRSLIELTGHETEIRTVDHQFTSSFPFDQPQHGTPPIRVPFISVLPRSFTTGHLPIIESERCTMNVKHHGRHFNVCFTGGAIYTNNRGGQVRRVHLPDGASLALDGDYVVDAELTMQDRGTHIDAVFHLFPMIVYKQMRDEIRSPRTPRDKMTIQPTWIIDEQHAECDALGAQIRAVMRRQLRQDYFSFANADGKPIRLWIVSKEWFGSIADMRRHLHGNLQLYNDDPCFPYEYLHHPTHPHLSCPVDGRIFNLLGPVGSEPIELECRPDAMMNSIIAQSLRNVHNPRERFLPPIDAVVLPNRCRITPDRYLAMQTDPHFVNRVRVAKFKRVTTFDLRIMNTVVQRNLLLRDKAVDRLRVHFVLACLNSVSNRQLDGVKAHGAAASDNPKDVKDYTFDQYVGLGVPHSDAIAKTLWESVVQQGRSIIVECALHQGAFFILSVRDDKHEPNHASSVLPSMLHAASTQHLRF